LLCIEKRFKSIFWWQLGRVELEGRQVEIRSRTLIRCLICVPVIADPGVTFIADPKKPGDDHLLVHAATISLMLRKAKAEQHICNISDALTFLRENIYFSLFFLSRSMLISGFACKRKPPICRGSVEISEDKQVKHFEV
jgi:hypothetical protein